MNETIECLPKGRNCATCGWNPEVAKERLEKFCAERGIKLPGSEEVAEEVE